MAPKASSKPAESTANIVGSSPAPAEFVYSENFLESNGGKLNHISIYGRSAAAPIWSRKASPQGEAAGAAAETQQRPQCF